MAKFRYASKIKYKSLYGICFLLFFIVSCTELQVYPDSYNKNLIIRTIAKSASRSSAIKVTLDIYKVDNKCNAKYLGTVRLDSAETNVGIPVNQATFLVFNFNSISMFSSKTSSVSERTLLMPKKDNYYRINVTYVDDIYSVQIKRSRPGSQRSRSIPLTGFLNC